MRKQVAAALLFFSLISILFAGSKILADELDDINHQLTNLKKEYEASIKATEPLEEDLQRLQNQLEQIRSRLSRLEAEVLKKEKEVKEGEAVLAYQKTLLEERTKSYYKNAKKSEVSFLNLLVAENLSTSLQNFFYQKTIVDQDKQAIIKIVLYIKGLEEKKKNLESEKSRLAKIKTEVDQQSQFLSAEISKAKKHQAELSQKIARLTTRQQELIAQKLAALNIPRSAATALKGCSDDRGVDPGFSPRFAFFTFGVPHRVGMNQYGALGRALAGQNEEEILRSYYDNFELKKDYDTGINITVDGYGTYNIEDYVKRIYEMPADWSLPALKAQVVAARSYALSYTNNGQGPICATQQCQVFKAEEKGGAWNQAVEETKGWVMVQGDRPIKAWYSSTHGGYVLKSNEVGWSDTAWTKHVVDTTGPVSSFLDLEERAYDKTSPWFYCDWGYRKSYNNTAWLTPAEVADIVNVIMLARTIDSVSDKEHLYQTDKPNPAGTDTWDEGRVKQELKNRAIASFNAISDVSVSVDFTGGKTTSVLISGDSDSVSLDGKEFKNWFNLRAPANIQIVGPLYKIEKQ